MYGRAQVEVLSNCQTDQRRMVVVFRASPLTGNAMIDKHSLAQDLQSLANVGFHEGGATRLAFSPEEMELHRRVAG